MVWWLLPSMNELSNLAKTRSKLKNRGMAVWDDEMKPWWQRGNNTLLCAEAAQLNSKGAVPSQTPTRALENRVTRYYNQSTFNRIYFS